VSATTAREIQVYARVLVDVRLTSDNYEGTLEFLVLNLLDAGDREGELRPIERRIAGSDFAATHPGFHFAR
jgi:hypothetical protein